MGWPTANSHPLFQALPQLWSFLGAEERRAVRASCQDGRDMANRLLNRLYVYDAWDQYEQLVKRVPESAGEVRAVVERLLASGVQPETLVLRLSESRRTAEALSGIGLGVLVAIAQRQQQQQHGVGRGLDSTFHPPTDLRLQGVPLSAPGLAAAVAQALPSLQRLTLKLYDQTPHQLRVRTTDGRPLESAVVAAEGVATLLRAAGPGLQHLSIECDSSDFWTPQLLSVLRERCTGLVSLSLKYLRHGCDAPLHNSLLESAASLTGLRSLKLCAAGRRRDAPRCRLWYGDSYFPVSDDEAGAEFCTAAASALARLTGLRQLVVRGFPAPAFVPALRHLTALVHLDAPNTELSVERDVAQLSALTALTHLGARYFSRDDAVVAAAGAGAGAAAGPSAAGVVSTMALRPALPLGLRSLELLNVVRPRALVAVQLPTSLTRLQLKQGLQIGDYDDVHPDDNGYRDDYDEDGGDAQSDGDSGDYGGAWGARLGPNGRRRRREFVEDLQGACRVCELLVGRLADSKCFKVESYFKADMYGYDFVDLIAALAPLRLRRLNFSVCLLDSEDVQAIASHLTGLEELVLGIISDTDELPLLGRGLPGLHHLEVAMNDCRETAEIIVEDMRQLFVAARKLTYLDINIPFGPDDDCKIEHYMYQLEPAMAKVKSKLTQAGRWDVVLAMAGNPVECEDGGEEEGEGEEEEDWGGAVDT